MFDGLITAECVLSAMAVGNAGSFVQLSHFGSIRPLQAHWPGGRGIISRVKRCDWKDAMTGHQPLQFVEHLRRAGHLKPTEAPQATDPGLAEQQGGGPRSPQAASLAKLWELTTLSSG